MPAFIRCHFCSKFFEVPYQNRERRKFCNKNCCAAFHNAKRRDPNFQRFPDLRGSQRAVATKRAQSDRVAVCAHCHQEYLQTGLQHNRKYCSKTCNQYAYLARKAEAERQRQLAEIAVQEALERERRRSLAYRVALALEGAASGLQRAVSGTD
jgi:hypothetical protein